MTFENTLNNMTRLAANASNRSEKKIYREFIQMIDRLQKKELSEAEIQSIEAQLETLSLDSTSGLPRRQLKKALHNLKTFLKESYSLTVEGYYTNLGVALGSSFGIVFGIVILSRADKSLGLSLGMSIGMVVGLIIGRKMDAQAKASGKMI